MTPPPARRRTTHRHRAQVRPRYGRLAAAGASVVVTAIALLGGSGVLPGVGSRSDATAGTSTRAGSGAAAPAAQTDFEAAAAPTSTPSSAPSAPPTDTSIAPSATATPSVTATPVPADSGQGRRVVFSQGQQRVWLIGQQGNVQRTYLVSGSKLDNLDPGRYQVYSRSRWAVGIDDSGVMQYFVRFTQGPTGAAIGFHSIPTSHGTPLQAKSALGTPTSHGCIRQAKHDAIALWRFAPLSTEVDVVAS